MVNEKKAVAAVDLKRQTLYSGVVQQVISLTANVSPTAHTFTFGSNNRILMATVVTAWPSSSWSNAMVTVSRITISNNIVTVELSTNATQNYTIGVMGLYYTV